MLGNHWDLFEEMENLRKEIDRAFNGFSRWQQPRFNTVFLPALTTRTYPLINIGEDENNLYVEALAPGINPDSLNISVVGNRLSISGEKVGAEVKEDAYHRNERAVGEFNRTIELPIAVDNEKVSATYKNGLLLITLAKAEEAKPKQITVKVN